MATIHIDDNHPDDHIAFPTDDAMLERDFLRFVVKDHPRSFGPVVAFAQGAFAPGPVRANTWSIDSSRTLLKFPNPAEGDRIPCGVPGVPCPVYDLCDPAAAHAGYVARQPTVAEAAASIAVTSRQGGADVLRSYQTTACARVDCLSVSTTTCTSWRAQALVTKGNSWLWRSGLSRDLWR